MLFHDGAQLTEVEHGEGCGVVVEICKKDTSEGHV